MKWMPTRTKQRKDYHLAFEGRKRNERKSSLAMVRLKNNNSFFYFSSHNFSLPMALANVGAIFSAPNGVIWLYSQNSGSFVVSS